MGSDISCCQTTDRQVWKEGEKPAGQVFPQRFMEIDGIKTGKRIAGFFGLTVPSNEIILLFPAEMWYSKMKSAKASGLFSGEPQG